MLLPGPSPATHPPAEGSALSLFSRPRVRALAVTAALVVPTALVLPALSAGAAQGSVGQSRPAPGTVELQLLNVSDFHGNLEPVSVNNVPVGGAAALSAYFAQDRARNPNTILFTSGDAVGASPPISSFFQDAPTIEWMNGAGFDAYALGNHDFDAGLGRLQEQIDQADFPYVGANLAGLEGNLSGIAPYEVLDVAGVKVAMIGLTNPEAPTLVAPGATGTIRITDPVQAAQKARAAAKREGASVFVAFGHLGVTAGTGSEQTGPLVDFANAVTGFDVIVGDHTDRQFEAVINGALVSENLSFGKGYSRTTLVVQRGLAPDNRGKGGMPDKVVSKDVRFVTPLVSGVTPDPEVSARVADLRTQVQARLDTPIGTAPALLPRSGNNERLGEAAIGNVTTDALRDAYGTQIAFTNGGGLRSPLPSGYQPADTSLRRPASGYASGPPFDLVLGDAYTLLPFGNVALTRTLTGAQLWSTLEHSVGSIPASNGKFLQISGFRFSYDASRPAGSRVVSVTLDDGTSIPNDAGVSVTATTNDFTNAGGDGFTMLADGQGVTRDLMANVLADYLVRTGSASTSLEGRITRLN
jgi:5'-nucleotidase